MTENQNDVFSKANKLYLHIKIELKPNKCQTDDNDDNQPSSLLFSRNAPPGNLTDKNCQQ